MAEGYSYHGVQAEEAELSGPVMKARKHLEVVLGECQRSLDVLENRLGLVMHEVGPTEADDGNVRPVSGVPLADQLDVLVAIARSVSVRLEVLNKRIDI